MLKIRNPNLLVSWYRFWNILEYQYLTYPRLGAKNSIVNKIISILSQAKVGLIFRNQMFYGTIHLLLSKSILHFKCPLVFLNNLNSSA